MVILVAVCESLATSPFIDMKRAGRLKSKWCNYDVLLKAWYQVKEDKSYFFTILAYEENLAVNLSNLLIVLENGTYQPRPLRSFYVYDPKTRLIEAPYLEDRIVQHALLIVIRDIVESQFIDQTFACIKERGTHASSDYLVSKLVNYKNKGYFLKVDIEKFFYTVDHLTLEAQYLKRIKCIYTLDLIQKFHKNNIGIGLPLGNVSSQLSANLALNPIDHFIKRELKIRHYVRYMDDMILLSMSKEQLRDAEKKIIVEVRKLNLNINAKTKISQIKHGIDFVGYRTWYNRRLIRKRSLYKIKRKLKQDPNLNRIASYMSHAMRTNSLIYIIKQILKVVPERREWIENWYKKHKK